MQFSSRWCYHLPAHEALSPLATSIILAESRVAALLWYARAGGAANSGGGRCDNCDGPTSVRSTRGGANCTDNRVCRDTQGKSEQVTQVPFDARCPQVTQVPFDARGLAPSPQFLHTSLLQDSKARPSTVPPASSAPGAASKPATQQRPPDRPLEKKNTVDIKNMADWDLSALPDDDASEEAAPSGQRRDSSDPEERSAPTSAPAEDPSGVPSTSGRAELSDPLANAIITLLRIPRNVELTLNLICTQLQVGKAHMAQPLALLAGALKHDPSLLEDAVLLRDVCESNLHLADKLTLALSAKQPDKASTLSCVEVFAQAVRKNQGGASATSSVTSVGAAAAAEVPARGATKRSHEQEESSTANKRSRAQTA